MADVNWFRGISVGDKVIAKAWPPRGVGRVEKIWLHYDSALFYVKFFYEDSEDSLVFSEFLFEQIEKVEESQLNEKAEESEVKIKELPKKFYVEIPNKEIGDIVQKTLFKLGYEWKNTGKEIYGVPREYPIRLVVGDFENKITYRWACCYTLEGYTKIPVSEIIERAYLKKEPEKSPEKYNLSDRFSLYVHEKEGLFERVIKKLIELGCRWIHLDGREEQLLKAVDMSFEFPLIVSVVKEKNTKNILFWYPEEFYRCKMDDLCPRIPLEIFFKIESSGIEKETQNSSEKFSDWFRETINKLNEECKCREIPGFPWRTLCTDKFKLKCKKEREDELKEERKKLPHSFKILITDKETGEAVQRKLFELGYEWRDGEKDEISHSDIYNYPLYYVINYYPWEKDSLSFSQLKDDDFLKFPQIDVSTFLKDAVIKKEERPKVKADKNLPDKFSVYIPTEEVDELVQQKLFDLGYYWSPPSATGANIFPEMPYWFFSDKKNLSYFSSESEKESYTEIPLSQILED